MAGEPEREGYVPNVVYSCGSMIHGETAVLPYGCSDSSARIAMVGLSRSGRPSRNVTIRRSPPVQIDYAQAASGLISRVASGYMSQLWASRVHP